MENKYFLYRHIRLDKYEPFYVGIGTKQVNSLYQRAYAKRNRNKWWYNITNKTDYIVEILLESDCLTYIKNKEIEFIKLYKPTLCNITKGGDFVSDKCMKQVFKYSLNGKFLKEYKSSADACRDNNISTSALNRCLNGKRINNNLAGFQWFYNYKGNTVTSVLLGRNSTKRKVRLYNDNKEYIFNSRKECAKFINRSTGRVSDLIKQGWFKNYKIEDYEN